MTSNSSSIFYFQQLPSSIQAETTTSKIVATSESTTISSTTATTTAPVCSSSGHGTLASLNLTTPTSLTQYSYNYTATTTAPILIFGFATEPGRIYYLDDVSVMSINATSTELLVNPSFENSSAAPVGWTSWCLSSCGTSPNPVANVTSGSNCYLSGQCYAAKCPNTGIIFLGQAFSAVAGRIYTISYRLFASGGGPNALNHFYVDVG